MTWNPCRVPKCKLGLVPEDPEKLQGPEVGQRVIYHDPKYPRWDGIEMRVQARSYVWSPEIHPFGVLNRNRGHGYRHYDWTVVEWDADRDGRSGSMVVDDDKLEVIE